jgi:hypothetical protein
MLIKLYNFVSKKLPRLSVIFRLCRTAPACTFLVKFTWCFTQAQNRKPNELPVSN